MTYGPEIIEHLPKLRDEDIQAMALHGGSSLSPEVIEALKVEIARRGLPRSLAEVADALNRPINAPQLKEVLDWVRKSNCPLCGGKEDPLNVISLKKVKSIIAYTSTKAYMVLGCPACIALHAEKATESCLVFGWWAIPFGPILTLMAIASNFKALKAAMNSEPTQYFLAYVEQNIGPLIHAMKSGKVGGQKFILDPWEKKRGLVS